MMPPNDSVDRIPVRLSQNLQFKPSNDLCKNLGIIDSWRFFNRDLKEFPWSNACGTRQSRIDVWLTSNDCLQHISEVSHCCAPLSDHKMILLHLIGSRENNSKVRGYWKPDCKWLQDKIFQDSVKLLAQDIFERKGLNHTGRWEFFKFQIRELAIRRGKNRKLSNSAKEKELMEDLKTLLNKGVLSEPESLKWKKLQVELDFLFLDAAKGASIRSRANWLEFCTGKSATVKEIISRL